jgi:predicted Rdx family selenoprotein
MTDPTTITAASELAENAVRVKQTGHISVTLNHELVWIFDTVESAAAVAATLRREIAALISADRAARAAGYTPGERMPPKDGTKFAAEVAGDVVLLWWDEHDCDFKEHTLRRGLREIRRWWELPGTGGQQ